MRANGWRARPGDRVARRPRQRETAPVRVRTPRPRRRVTLPAASSALLSLAGGFALLITVGTGLLMLPLATASGESAPFVAALFTATSAVCVTGLVVESSATYWSGFGQAVLAALMFTGGLGIMSAGLVMLAAGGRRITLNQRLLVRETLGGAALGSAFRLVRYILIFAVAAQALGFALLFARLIFSYPAPQALWQSLFHSVSAFNNAGFTIFPDSESLAAFRSDPALLAIIGGGVILGALSFSVVNEVARRKGVSRWTLDTRLVVIGTLGLWGVGALTMLAFEAGNPATLGGMTLLDRIVNGAFQATTARTAGFSSIDFGQAEAGSSFLFMIMMFVGGASGSVAGGIKINTVMVIIVATLAVAGGRPRAEFDRREIPRLQVARALALLVLGALGVSLFVAALAWSERGSIGAGDFAFVAVMFEAVSAFGTVGLSHGITPDLSTPGKIIVTLAMYVGRLGPLTIALGLAMRERRAVYRYAEERVRIG